MQVVSGLFLPNIRDVTSMALVDSASDVLFMSSPAQRFEGSGKLAPYSTSHYMSSPCDYPATPTSHVVSDLYTSQPAIEFHLDSHAFLMHVESGLSITRTHSCRVLRPRPYLSISVKFHTWCAMPTTYVESRFQYMLRAAFHTTIQVVYCSILSLSY